MAVSKALFGCAGSNCVHVLRDDAFFSNNMTTEEHASIIPSMYSDHAIETQQSMCLWPVPMQLHQFHVCCHQPHALRCIALHCIALQSP